VHFPVRNDGVNAERTKKTLMVEPATCRDYDFLELIEHSWRKVANAIEVASAETERTVRQGGKADKLD
jgi:hypothetical protein